MDQFLERLFTRAATIDERLSATFESTHGQKAEADAAGRRLAAWCRSSASGDWTLFAQRLARDDLSLDKVLPRLASVRWRPGSAIPGWASDAIWIDAAFARPGSAATFDLLHSAGEPVAFEHLLAPIVEEARERLWDGLRDGAAGNLTTSAIACLCYSLASEMSELCAPALFAQFQLMLAEGRAEPTDGARADETGHSPEAARSRYDRFVLAARAGGFRDLFDAKPVLLRLVATIVRQWIDTTRELIQRLHEDLPALVECFLARSPSEGAVAVARIDGHLSDRHNGGRSVKLLQMTDGSRILYKPKDIRLDAAWKNLVERLNEASPPVDLRAVRVLARDGYGWAEYIHHVECAKPHDFVLFFRRAGAWLCLFHLFVGTDMHEQNMIASGAHPIPIDLEMLLQSLPPAGIDSLPETQAATLAGQQIIESVTMTGLLPSYWRTPENTLVGSGGLNNIKAVYTEVAWECTNTDAMRPVLRERREDVPRNLPSLNGEEARLADHVDDVVHGFEDYAAFLCANKSEVLGGGLFDGFGALRTRRVMKNTRYYCLLLERLKDHRNMTDGAEWSAHLDFGARFSDWSKASDPLWPIVRSERQALAELCVPHFVSSTDACQVADAFGDVAAPVGQPGVERARQRYAAFDSIEIPWQVQVIRLSTHSLGGTPERSRRLESAGIENDLTEREATEDSDNTLFLRVASDISSYLSQHAVRRGLGASWIGLDWLGHSGLCRPTSLGDDLYSGTPGVCLFLAAQAMLSGDESARDLSIAGLSALRHNLRSANGPRFARSIGIGGATGVGSIVYSLVTMYRLLEEESLLHDAQLAAALITPDLVAADWALDVFDGSAGCILGLLKLFEVNGAPEILGQAVLCGEHLLRQARTGDPGRRSWLGLSVAERSPAKLSRALNGMSHGAAGFAYALATLAKLSGRSDFGHAAEECIQFENETFSETRSNWPDFRLKGSETEPAWVCQWCHGAGGIGLARIGTLRRGAIGIEQLVADIHRAVRGVQAAWPYPGDNLCCGNLGNLEFLTEAGRALGMSALVGEASRRLHAILSAASIDGEYLFDGLDRRFDLGMFRGIAGVGYTCLRQASTLVPSVLTWE